MINLTITIMPHTNSLIINQLINQSSIVHWDFFLYFLNRDANFQGIARPKIGIHIFRVILPCCVDF